MLLRSLLSSLVLLASTAHALDTVALPESTLKAYGATLATAAGSNQWQQLWKSTRQAGHFTPSPSQAYFSVPMSEIPALAARTLTEAHSVNALKQTQALYRRDFRPKIVGHQDDQPLTALCLWVDWRSLPAGSSTSAGGSMQQVSLLLSRPCE